MQGRNLYLNRNYLSFSVVAYNRAGCENSSRSFVWFNQFVKRVTTDSTFTFIYEPLSL